MAAYAALVSLLNNMEQIMAHPHFSTSFDKEQIESLLPRVDFLLEFIETHNSYGESDGKEEAKELEQQIASAAHAAEDVFEFYIVRLIRAAPVSLRLPAFFYEKIMEAMDSMKEKVMKAIENRGYRAELPESPMAAALSRPLNTGKSNMVGFDDYLTQLLEELTGYQSDRKIIPIVGMGGIGKTTLARNAYDNLLIVHHFDARAWVTVSEGYNVIGVLFKILSCLGESNIRMDGKTEHELGELLHKTLSGLRYLIIFDDMWSIDVWDEIKFFFPNNCNRSRIIVTTRIFNVANHFGSRGIALNILDDDHSWKLFCDKVFLGEVCPPELEESGKKIVEKCKGLPLSIVVICGLLGNSSRTLDQWENVEKDVRSILGEGDNRCSRLLSLSYNHLPACLKPCFLYLAIFSENEVIHVSRLIKLWVAEGFIKPNNDQSLEEIAEGYIEDLVGRNLIYVHSVRWNGKLKTCCIHDLLRDLCIREAEKEEFLFATSELDAYQDIHSRRRHIIQKSTAGQVYFYPRSLVRSLICKGCMPRGVPKLLRVFVGKSLNNIVSQVNLRFIACDSFSWIHNYHLPSSISLHWNVQTIIMTGRVEGVVASSAIWDMSQLRHLKFKSLTLPDPSPNDAFVLHKLQTLGKVVNFKCSEEARKRIPNVKKLHVYYADFSMGAETWSYYSLQNFVFFNSLESLNIGFIQQPNRDDLLQSLIFPNSLKKLTLECCQLWWTDMTIFGSLPNLEALKIWNGVSGPSWDPVEGEFLRLKYLRIYFSDLICWNADNTHFPLLESLVLEKFYNLAEIPSGIGDIPTLERISLVDCSTPATLSAIRIVEEQESLGNESLQVKVDFQYKPNFEKFMEQVNLEGITGLKFRTKGA